MREVERSAASVEEAVEAALEELGISEQEAAVQQERLRASLVQETDVECPKCGSRMVKRFGRSGPFLACPRYPECKATLPLEEDAQAAEAPPGVVCPLCQSPMRVRTGRFGKFLACSRYPECKGTRPFTLQIPCPKCGQGELVERRTRRGKPFYGCSRYPECDFGIGCRNHDFDAAIILQQLS